MRLAFKKLFDSGPDSAKTSPHNAIIQEVESMYDGERCGGQMPSGKDGTKTRR